MNKVVIYIHGKGGNASESEFYKNIFKEHDATLTVMEEGEHWFHTDEQMQYVKEWIESFIE